MTDSSPIGSDGYHMHISYVRKPVSEAGRAMILSILSGESVEDWLERHPEVEQVEPSTEKRDDIGA